MFFNMLNFTKSVTHYLRISRNINIKFHALICDCLLPKKSCRIKEEEIKFTLGEVIKQFNYISMETKCSIKQMKETLKQRKNTNNVQRIVDKDWTETS